MIQSLFVRFKHFPSEWPDWWETLSPFQKIIPLIVAGSYLSIFWFLGLLHNDHLYVWGFFLLLSYGGFLGRSILKFFLPLLLSAVLYEGQQFYGDYIRGTIRVAEPYLLEKALFGIQTVNGILTPNEFLQQHLYPALDLITGFTYLIFLSGFVAICAYVYFWMSQKGTSKYSSFELSRRVPWMMWAFFFLNVLGFSTYYWFPAAPPWYVALYGLGPARMDILPNAAGCLRFDEILGIHFFSGMYGRAIDVFGAIPSLPLAYPLLNFFFS